MSRLLPVLAGLLIALGLAAALAPGAAQASDQQLSVFQDDDLLLYRNDQTRDNAMRRMKESGADAVRVTVLWSVVAENANDGDATPAQKQRFRRLTASNPKAYPKLNWDRFDRLVRACRTLRLICYFNITGPGPSYAHEKPPAQFKKDAKWWKPKPRQFYSFVQAVGKRYSGSFRDENDGRQVLPRVGIWSLWNEPNQGAWLRPQWLSGQPQSPKIYRALWFFGKRALVSTGHGNDLIMAGETAPRSVSRRTTTSAMGAKTFMTEFFCQGTTQAGCDEFDKNGGSLGTSTWAHHFYTRKDAPSVRDPDPETLDISKYPDFLGMLDGFAATGRAPQNMQVMNSEFGYESNPPDTFNGVSLAQQAAFNMQGEFLSYLQPRVIGHAQFLLRDTKGNRRFSPGTRGFFGTYQSGLFTTGDTPKPAATAYAFPLLSLTTGTNPANGGPIATLWGQLRFRGDGLQDQVQLQFKPADGSSDYTNFGDPLQVTNPKGYFLQEVTFPGPGFIRGVWTGAEKPFEAATLEQYVG